MGTNYQVNPFGQGSTMPSGYPIADNLTTDSAQQALSARQGLELNAKLTGYKSIDLSSFTKIDSFIHSNGKWASMTPYKSIFVPVEGGKTYELTANDSNDIAYSVLTSDSHATGEKPAYSTGYSGVPTIAAKGKETIVMPSDAAFLYLLVVGGDSVDKMPSSFKMFVGSFVDDKIGMSDEDVLAHMPPSVPSWINQNFNNWITEHETARCTLVPVEEGEKYMITGNANHGSSFAVLGEGQPVVNETPNYVSPYTIPVIIGECQIIEFEIPEGGKYIYISNIGPSGTDYTPSSFIKVSKGRYVAKSRIPGLLDMGEPTNIIYTIDDFLMAHEYDENNNIDRFKFSNDLGETWTDPVTNIWGTLVNIFMFADGTLFFAGYKDDEGSRCYWTRDFETFTECTVIDYDGYTYVPVAGARRFGEIQAKTNHVYVNGTEYYCCGDYIISSSHPRIWYAISGADGVTVRAAFCFGYDEIDGVVIPARHYHSFDYNPYDGNFYALTGDNDTTECNILRGTHDANHVWTWERVAYGPKYKLASITFDAGNMYAITDYTSASLRSEKGVLSVPINDINENRFRYWFKPTEAFMLEGSYYGSNNPAALSASVVDNHGWRIIGLDYAGNSKMLIAKGGHNYSWIDNNAGVKLKGWIGPNNKGDIYVWWYTPGFSVSGDDWVKFSHRTTYNFTEIMRNSGATDFFEGYVGTPR